MAIDRKPWQRLLYEIWASVTEGHAFEVEPLTVTENDTYTAPEGKAYSPVTVNVAGGASVGNPVQLTRVTYDSKSGDYIYAGSGGINSLYLGENVLIGAGDEYSEASLSSIASGVTMKSSVVPALGQDDDAEIYLVTAKPDIEYPEYEVIDTITPLETDVHTYIDDGNKYFTLTIPEIAQGAYLGILWTVGD